MSVIEVSKRLEELKRIRESFDLRADLLAADLALNGLVDDLIGAAEAAIVLAPEFLLAAFSLTRTAFEAAQRIVVLATDDDYLGTGTRAWLYYHRKNMRLVRQTRGDEDAHTRFEDEVEELRRIWKRYNERADDLLRDENARLLEYEKTRRPDNFMGRDLAAAVQDRYPKIAKQSVQSLSELKTLNNAIYSALSRESHSRLRVEIAGLEISLAGTVRIIPQRPKHSLKAESIVGAIDSSLSEAIAALAYLFERRREEETERTRPTIQQLGEGPLKPGFKPDLGLQLARMDGLSTIFHFRNVPVHRVGVFEDGSISLSADIQLTDREYAATFDVPWPLGEDFARAIDVPVDLLRRSGKLHKHTLRKEAHVNLECLLGSVQQNSNESVVPLIVRRVTKGATESNGA